MSEPNEPEAALATVEPSPLAIIATAIDKGIDPQKLLDWQRQIEAMKAQRAYTEAMNAAQAEMPVIVRDKVNTFIKNRYASLEQIQEQIRPVLTKYGLAISWGKGDSPLEGHMRILANVMHRDGHIERFFGDYPRDGQGAKGGSNMNPLQGVVSSNTYAQRDMLRSIFNVTIADTDMDGSLEGDTLTEGQIDEVTDLLLQCKEKGQVVDLPRFLKWLDVESIEKMPQRLLQKAVDELKRKLKPQADQK